MREKNINTMKDEKLEWKKGVPFVLNFHLTKVCNMKCAFCFGGFKESEKLLSKEQWILLIKKIGKSTKHLKDRRINFAGGEPLLYPHLAELIRIAKREGFKTSMITNGSLLTEKFLDEVRDCIDMIGISIDSVSNELNEKSGRMTKYGVLTVNDYIARCNWISERGIKLKVNTVIHKYNVNQDMASLLENVSIERWKVLRMLKIKNENADAFPWYPTKEKFDDFVSRHQKYNPVVEDNEDMISAYLFVSPSGYLMDNSEGEMVSAASLIERSFTEALESISFDVEVFSKRYNAG